MAAHPTMLGLDSIAPNPNNPRKTFDEAKLAELAASFQSVGVLEPLVVRLRAGDGGGPDRPAELIAGERRWRAAQLAGLAEVPVRIVELDDAAAAEAMLAENLQRADLTPPEEARAFQAWIAAQPKPAKGERPNWPKALAGRLGKSEDYIRERLLLLDLDDDVLGHVEAGRVTLACAVALARVKDREVRAEVLELLDVGQEDLNEWPAIRTPDQVSTAAEEIADRRKWEAEEAGREEAEKSGGAGRQGTLDRFERERREWAARERREQLRRAEAHKAATAAAYAWVRGRKPAELAKLAVEAMGCHGSAEHACAAARLLGFYDAKKRDATRTQIEKRARAAQGPALTEMLCALIVAWECGESDFGYGSGPGAASAFCKRHGIKFDVPKPAPAEQKKGAKRAKKAK